MLARRLLNGGQCVAHPSKFRNHGIRTRSGKTEARGAAAMRNIAIFAAAISVTLGTAGALALVLTRSPVRAHFTPYETAMPNTLQSEPAPYPPPQEPAAQEIEMPTVLVVTGRPHHPSAAPTVDVMTKCGDWQDLKQGPATSKVRICN
jgi:hypothetical protein